MSVLFWILVYLAVTGAITFGFCCMQMKIGKDPVDGLMLPVICGVFWVIAGVPYAAYSLACYYNEFPEKAPWNKPKKPKGKTADQLFQEMDWHQAPLFRDRTYESKSCSFRAGVWDDGSVRIDHPESPSVVIPGNLVDAIIQLRKEARKHESD